MSLLVVLFSALLFFVLSPGVVVRLPRNGGKFTVAGVHAVIFALIFWLTHKFVGKLGAKLRLEGFETPKATDDSKKNK
jgi:lipopolysaccharide export LptBFGC system permease protein LptF